MIYRLRNNETKKLATNDDMKYLRVNALGEVEKLITKDDDFDRKELLDIEDVGYGVNYMTLHGELASCGECTEHFEDPNTNKPYCEEFADNKFHYYPDCPTGEFEIDEDCRDFTFEASEKVEALIRALFAELRKEPDWQPAPEWSVEWGTVIKGITIFQNDIIEYTRNSINGDTTDLLTTKDNDIISIRNYCMNMRLNKVIGTIFDEVTK